MSSRFIEFPSHELIEGDVLEIVIIQNAVGIIRCHWDLGIKDKMLDLHPKHEDMFVGLVLERNEMR